ncbi:hypothetical protein L0128_04460, partial [candidate division KSB1 bacterium]|nr:hypothetical protein [candidate division KSB1 bacterium]
MPVTSTIYQMLPRSINSSLSLKNRPGNEVAIIYPGAFAGYEALAMELAHIIAQQGGDRAPVIADTQIMATRATPLPPSYRQRPLILLGNLNTNRAILPLYAQYYCAADAIYPGGEGYDLRTLVNPYGTGTNVILAGGSVWRGVARAVDRLKTWIESAAKSSDSEVPYLLEVDLAPTLARQLAAWPETPLNVPLPNLADGMRKALGFNEGLIRAIGSYAILYSWTGDVRYAEYARDCLRILNQLMADSYGDWHYRAERILRALPLLSAGGFLSPEDLRRTDQLLLGTALGTQDMWWRLKSAAPPLGHRHHGRGTFEFYLLARYLRDQARPNPAVQALCERWIEECHTFLDALGSTDGTDDQDDESSLNNMATLFWYALGAERFDFFEHGHARRVAYRALALHDNAGAGAGQGGYGEALSGALYFQQEATIPVAAAACYFQDRALKWILSHLPNLSTPLRYGFLHFAPPFMHKFDTGDELIPETPAALSGIQRLPITRHQLAIDNHPPEHIEYAGHLVNAPETWLQAEGIAVNQLPRENGFDKLVLRSGFTPADAYLLLQGYQGGYRWQGHNHAANCIVRFGQAGHIFLIQNTSRHSHFHKNGLFIGDGFDTEPLPPFAEWLAIDDFPQVGMTATRLSNYHHTDWQRHLFWDKRNGGLWVVLDSIVPKANGPYSCTCTWRTPGFATLEARTWRARQGDHLFTLISSEMLAATNETNNAADLQGAANPYILRQFKNGALTIDDWITFQNLFFVRPFPNAENYDLHWLASG